MAGEDDDTFIIPAPSAAQPAPRNLTPPPSGESGAQDDTFVIPSTPTGPRSLAGDIGRLFYSSFLDTVGAGVGAAEYAAGSGGMLTAGREGLTGEADRVRQGVSPQMHSALQREFIPGGEGPSAWASFGDFFGALGAQAVASLGSIAAAVPAIAAGIAGAGPLGGAIAGGATAGVLGMGSVWNDTAQEFQRVPEAQRRAVNATYRRLREEGVDEASALNETVREASGQYPELAGVLSVIPGMVAGRFEHALGARGLSRGMIRSALTGGATEAGSEWVEEGTQSGARQFATQPLTGQEPSFRQTLEDATRGAIGGGAMGGGMGLVGGAVGRNEPRPAEEPPAPPPPAPSTREPGVDPAVQGAVAARGPTPPAGPSRPSSPMADPLGAQQWAQSDAARSSTPRNDPAITAALTERQGTTPTGAAQAPNAPGVVADLAAQGQAAAGFSDPQAGVVSGLAREGALGAVTQQTDPAAGTLYNLAEQGAQAGGIADQQAGTVPGLARAGALDAVTQRAPTDDTAARLADQGAPTEALGAVTRGAPSPAGVVPLLAAQGEGGIADPQAGTVPGLASAGALDATTRSAPDNATMLSGLAAKGQAAGGLRSADEIIGYQGTTVATSALLDALRKRNPKQAQRVEETLALVAAAQQDGVLPETPTPKEIRDTLGPRGGAETIAASLIRKEAAAQTDTVVVAATGSDSAASTESQGDASVGETTPVSTTEKSAPTEALAPPTQTGDDAAAPAPEKAAKPAPKTPGEKRGTAPVAEEKKAESPLAPVAAPLAKAPPKKGAKAVVPARNALMPQAALRAAPREVPPKVRDARRQARESVLATTRQVAERHLGETYSEREVVELVDALLDDAMNTIGDPTGKSVREIETLLVNAVMEPAARAVAEAVARSNAPTVEEAAEQGAPKTSAEKRLDGDSDTRKRISANLVSDALGGNDAAVRAVLQIAAKTPQDKLGGWYRDHIAPIVAERGAGEPDWVTELRSIAEGGQRGGSDEAKAKRNAEVRARMETLAGARKKAETSLEGARTAIETAFTNGAGAPATESVADRAARYRALRAEIVKITGVGSAAAQLARLPADARLARAIVQFANRVGRAAPDALSEETSQGHVFAELLLRSGSPDEAMAALTTQAAEATGLGTGGMGDSESAPSPEVAADTTAVEALSEVDMSSEHIAKLMRQGERRIAPTMVSRDARRQAPTTGAVRVQTEAVEGDAATDAEVAAFRAARAAKSAPLLVSVTKQATTNRLSLRKDSAVNAAGIDSDTAAMALLTTEPVGIVHGGDAALTARLFDDGQGNALMRGLWSRLQRAVPDVEVRIMPDALWDRVGGRARAVFFPADPRDVRDNGVAPGIIFAPERLFAGTETDVTREVVMHEMVHAATFASVLVEGSKSRARLLKLMRITRDGLLANGVDIEKDSRLRYALTNPEEFIAVAMTNPEVQETLAGIMLTPQQRKSLGLIGYIDNAFRAFVAWVRDTLGMPPGYSSVLEGVIEVGSFAIQDRATQRAQLAQFLDPRLADNNAKALAGMFEAPAFLTDRIGRLDESFLANLGQRSRQAALGFTTMRQIEQAARRLFVRDERTTLLMPDTDDNPVEIAAKAHNHRNVLARDRLKSFLAPLQKFEALTAAQNQTVSELLIDATIAEAHPDADIDGTGKNKHLQGNKARQVQGRARHAGLKARYDALSQAEKDAYQATVKALREAHTTAVNTIIDYAVDRWFSNAVDQNLRDPAKHPLPATANDLPGLKQRAKADKLTPADADMLGDDVVEALKTARTRNEMKGPYVPLQRFGEYVVSWKEDAPEVMKFATEAEADAHIESSEYAALSKTVHHFDAAGDEITEPAADLLANEEGLALSELPADASPQDRAKAKRAAKVAAKKATIARDSKSQEHRVQQQTNGLAFFETIAEANAAARELRAAGMSVDATRLRDRPGGRSGLVQDRDFEKMKSAIERDQTLPEAYRNAAIDALAGAYLMVTPNRTLSASLIKRRKVIGASKDVRRVLATYGVAVSNFSAGMETALPITLAIKSMRQQSREGAQNVAEDDGTTLQRDLYIREMETRLSESPNEAAGGRGSEIPLVRKLQSLSYIYYLASPSYSMIQMAQPWMLSMPVLAARYGMRPGAGALTRAMKDIGIGAVMSGGVKDTANAMRTLFGGAESGPQPILEGVKSRLKTQRDGADLVKMIEALEREGLVDGEAGLELVRAELTRDSRAGRMLGQTEALARAFPAAIEVVNRTSTAVAAYRLARAKGNTHEQAVKAARDVVDMTQGDYSSSNTARFMDPRRYPWLAPMMTFRKYAQAIYALIGRQAYLAFKDADPAVRREARRTLMFTLGAHAMVAGALGLPTEAITVALGAVAMLMGSDEPWDWEREVRQALAQALGPELAEIVARGLPRAAGIDLHGRMGLNSLLFINDLRDFDQKSLMQYAGQLLLGAPGAMVANMAAAPQQIMDGNYGRAVEGAVPKGVRDVMKAIRFGQEGVTTRRGERIDENTNFSATEAVVQALGFSPARVAETYERRDAVQGANRQMTEERNTLIRRYRQADPADRADVWREIVEWNRGIPAEGRESRITRDTLLRALQESRRRARVSGGGDYLPRGREYLRREGEFANTRRDQ